jgi:hypothetical protein
MADAVNCQTCISWKRRDEKFGTCWRKGTFPDPSSTTHEEFVCHKWEAKVIRVNWIDEKRPK